MQTPDNVLYTAIATATGGRTGSARSDDGKLDIELSTPKQLGGAGGDGSNPEQLFAAGYSACFIGALQHVAASQKIKLGNNVQVTGEVGIGPAGAGFALTVKLLVKLPDLDKASAQQLADQAHQVCPYSNATRGNIDVTIEVA
ncbi:organic hydroperoxide resistance protein [Idiomarina xiamenensis]|uniref:Putative organic hydroperoxide resistance protein n=1 Tax=Idiomarina xiamenensis 10-D-4 TaxID=740709 RepID=K2KII2_9GAMM|nr:organic hydroperoxide resistance protein [Idiomarina xiamenensis]EKE87678.1 putative organic hydroperoxide resistance protein [Idiomarina xiamenensis 10-D-4]